MDSPVSLDREDNLIGEIQNALQLNGKISELIKSKRSEFLERLDEIKSSAVCSSQSYFDDTNEKTNKRSQAISIYPFFKPYLRDRRGLRAPSLFNTDETLDLTLLTNITFPKQVRIWTQSECDIIKKEVRSQYLTKYTRELTVRWEELLEQQSREPKSIYKEEIQKISTEIALCRTKNLEPEINSSDIDWLVVSKLLQDDRLATDCELYYNNQLHCSINQSDWSEDEDNQLINLVEQYSNDWDLIAEKLNSGRLAWQCCSRYQSEYNLSLRRIGQIYGDEAKQLTDLIERNRCGDFINWFNVAGLFEGRSLPQIKHFYNKSHVKTLKKPWLFLEDQVILAGCKLFGLGKWVEIAKFLPGRSNKQVRERYYNQLAFGVRKLAGWTKKEDFQLLKMSTQHFDDDFNINFSAIQELYFPNRNKHQLYRRYIYLYNKLPENFNIDSLIQSNRKPNIKFKTKKRNNDSLNISYNIEDITDIEGFLFSSRNVLLSSSDSSIPSSSSTSNSIVKEFQISKQYCVQKFFMAQALSNDEKHIDDDLSLYVGLQSLRSHLNQKYQYSSKLDHISIGLMQIVSQELLMPDLVYEPSDEIQCFQHHPSLDLIRFFITSSSVHLNNCKIPDYCDYIDNDVPKALFLPNLITLFAYSSMRVMSNAAKFQLAQYDYEFDESKIVSTKEFSELRTTFRSLFLWPHLVSTKMFTEEQRRKSILEGIPTAPSIEEVEEEEVQTRGKKKKRKFFCPVNEYAKLRSLQLELFTLSSKHDIFYQNLNTGNRWMAESRMALQTRAQSFYDYVTAMVVVRLNEKECNKKIKVNSNVAQKKSNKDRKKKTPKPKITECDLRRSSRSSTKTHQH